MTAIHAILEKFLREIDQKQQKMIVCAHHRRANQTQRVAHMPKQLSCVYNASTLAIGNSDNRERLGSQLYGL